MKNKLTQEHLKKKYGCSGCCYGGQEYIDGQVIEYQICHNIDFCEETRHGEFLASVFSVVFLIIGVPILTVLAIYFFIFY